MSLRDKSSTESIKATKTIDLRRSPKNNMGIQSQNARLEYVQIVKAALKRRQLAGNPSGISNFSSKISI